MYKMMGMEGVAQAMLSEVPLQIFQYFRMNSIRPNNPIPNTFNEEGCSGKELEAEKKQDEPKEEQSEPAEKEN